MNCLMINTLCFITLQIICSFSSYIFLVIKLSLLLHFHIQFTTTSRSRYVPWFKNCLAQLCYFQNNTDPNLLDATVYCNKLKNILGAENSEGSFEKSSKRAIKAERWADY